MKQLALALTLLLAPTGKMYKWVDDKGHVHYSETHAHWLRHTVVTHQTDDAGIELRYVNRSALTRIL